MATSGTLGTTVIDTATLLEHAFRRAGVSSVKQTPEVVQAAMESLYMLLLGMSNRGYNLWCLEQIYVGLTPGIGKYILPVGTLNVSNVVFSQPTLATRSNAVLPTSIVSDAGASTSVTRVGVALSAPANDTIVGSYSSDNISWSTFITKSGDLDTVVWLDIPGNISARYWRVTTTTATPTDMVLASSVYDLPVSPWNWDTYMAMNNKAMQSRPSTNYLLERKLECALTLWPVPTTQWDHLSLLRHRQIQDIGALTDQIEIPQRWLEGITWQAAFRVAVEVPGVDKDRLTLCKEMAENYTNEVEDDESDGMPLMIVPRIGGYTR